MSSSFWAAATSSAVKPRYAVVPQLVMSAGLDNIYKRFTPQVRSLPRDEYIATVYDWFLEDVYDVRMSRIHSQAKLSLQQIHLECVSKRRRRLIPRLARGSGDFMNELCGRIIFIASGLWSSFGWGLLSVSDCSDMTLQRRRYLGTVAFEFHLYLMRCLVLVIWSFRRGQNSGTANTVCK